MARIIIVDSEANGSSKKTALKKGGHSVACFSLMGPLFAACEESSFSFDIALINIRMEYSEESFHCLGYEKPLRNLGYQADERPKILKEWYHLAGTDVFMKMRARGVGIPIVLYNADPALYMVARIFIDRGTHPPPILFRAGDPSDLLNAVDYLLGKGISVPAGQFLEIQPTESGSDRVEHRLTDLLMPVRSRSTSTSGALRKLDPV